MLKKNPIRKKKEKKLSKKSHLQNYSLFSKNMTIYTPLSLSLSFLFSFFFFYILNKRICFRTKYPIAVKFSSLLLIKKKKKKVNTSNKMTKILSAKMTESVVENLLRKPFWKALQNLPQWREMREMKVGKMSRHG